MNSERRYIPIAEFRATEENGQPVIEGYAALYDTPSLLLGSDARQFRESIARGAFARVLSTDVRALFNHDPNYVLGRTTAGTLTLADDQYGLKMRVTPPETQWARDLMTSIRRGDISGMSFAFKVAPGGQRFERLDGEIHRTVSDIAELLDVSPVTYPAYPDTTVAARSLDEWVGSQEPLPIIEPTGFLERSRRQLVQAMKR